MTHARILLLALLLPACFLDGGEFVGGSDGGGGDDAGGGGTADAAPDPADADVTPGPIQGLLLSATELEVLEGGQATVAVALALEPAADVVLALAIDDPAIAAPTVAELTFTPDDFATPKTIALGGTADGDALAGDTTLRFTLDGEDVAGTVAVHVTDDDTQGLLLDVTAIELAEDGTGTFEVSLVMAPPGDVVVAISSLDPAVALPTTSSLTFTPGDYATPREVTIQGTPDADAHFDATTIQVASTGIPTRTVAASIVEPTILNLSGSQLLCVNESRQFSVSLDGSPGAPRTFQVSSSASSHASVSVASLTFGPSNYGTPQTFSVHGNSTGEATIRVRLDGGNLLAAARDVEVVPALLPPCQL